MNLIRLKRLWDLSRKDPETLIKLQSLTDEEINLLPDENYDKAIFMTEPTEVEYKKMEEEEKGLKHIFGKGL